MKQWRVGTLSMGIMLIVSGCILLVSDWKGDRVYEWLYVWWPIIFILLGLEMIAYLFLQRKQETLLKYDVFSILFVGVLGMACIGMMAAASTGVMGEIRYAVSAQERSVELSEISQEVPDGVSRVVVQADAYGLRELHISASSSNRIHMMGSYRDLFVDDAAYYGDFKDEAAAVHVIGDTMHIRLKQPPRKHGLSASSPRVDWTLVLPEQLNVHIQAGHNQIKMEGATPERWTISVDE